MLSYLAEEERWFAWEREASAGPARRTLGLPDKPKSVKGTLLTAAEVIARPPDETPLYWQQLRTWVSSLLERQRWLPLLRPEGRNLLAFKAPCWDLPEDAEIFLHLVSHLPGCAVFPWGRPREIVIRAAELLLEACAQQRLAHPLPLKVPRSWPAEARGWIEAHYGLDDLEISREGVRVAQDLLAWSRHAVGNQSAWRTCFTLHEPVLEEDPWSLTFALQARAESSLVLEAEEIWSGQASVLARSAGHSLERPGEILLTDLGRAARLSPELRQALQQRHPERAELSLTGTSQFLRETAWLLQESGYGVRLPVSLTARRPRLRLRSRRASSGGGGVSSGALSIDKITQFSWQAEVNGQALSLKELRQLAKAKQPLVRLKGQWIMLEAGSAQQMLRAAEQDEGSLGEILRSLPADAQGDAFEVEIDEVMLGLQSESALQDQPAPAGLKATLRPYQLRGYSWLGFLGERGLGACLADDMGLGKTVQLLSWILRDRELRGAGSVLLICPTSVLGNWQREAARFAPDLPVRLYYGPQRKLDLAEQPFVLTSYALAQRDGEILSAVAWRGVVLDEAQNIKNPEALQTRAIRRLPADFRVALTGTPVENRLQELWSLMDFLNPGLLGTRTAFQRNYARPIEKERDEVSLGRLQKMVRPFLLRRLKSDPAIVPDLPAKQEIKTYCGLTSEQTTLYAAVLQEAMDAIEEKEGVERRGLVLKLLVQLKQVCNHPNLFLNDKSPFPKRSGKLERLQEMLEELLEGGQASLIFTQFATFAQKLAAYLSQMYRCPVPCLHGGLRKDERDQMVENFQSSEGPPILVLSLKAGGVGLNLTRASRVFHFDRWWNPAVENQATDRAYRLGQKQAVQVYKFIVEGSLEETIDAMIESKMALATNVLSADESWLTELDNRALRDLLQLRPTAGGVNG